MGFAYTLKHLNYRVRNDLMPEQLEFIVIEVNKPNSVPMFISTWYRPGTPIELFDIFESVLEKIDSNFNKWRALSLGRSKL